MRVNNNYDLDLENFTPETLLRIGGFLDLNNKVFAESLEISESYLNRVLNYKDPLSKKLKTRTLALVKNYLKEHPRDYAAETLCLEILKQIPLSQYFLILSCADEYRRSKENKEGKRD